MGCRDAWWDARWLGLNQTAIVVDVRAPFVIMGFMLGETAVGLYGLVQRTTAIVELAWASISKLLLKSYAETAATNGSQDVRSSMLAASKLTGCIMAGLTVSVWAISLYVGQVMELSEGTSVALSLLRWALVAISLSSLKRPLHRRTASSLPGARGLSHQCIFRGGGAGPYSVAHSFTGDLGAGHRLDVA